MRLTRREVLKGSGVSLAAALVESKTGASNFAPFPEQPAGESNGLDGAAAPPNALPALYVDPAASVLRLEYNGATIFSGKLSISTPKEKILISKLGIPLAYPGNPATAQRFASIVLQESVGLRNSIEGVWHFVLYGANPEEGLELDGWIAGSAEAFPAETFSEPQVRFPLIRNSSGLSRNLRNNAIYDRHFDWVLSGPGTGQTKILPEENGQNARRFGITLSGTEFTLSFRPHLYQKHKGIAFFEPWRSPAWSQGVQGWSSWWAYRNNIDQSTIHRVADLFAQKLLDYGYRYIQIDDGYERAETGLPADELTTNTRFPDGLAELSRYIAARKLEPAIWVNVPMHSKQEVEEHPAWFVPGNDGRPYLGPWVGYGIDGTNPEAIDHLVRPIYRTIASQGWRYVKIDTLRHLLYDSYDPCRAYFLHKGTTPEQAFRNVLEAARQELGNETYLLSCWGVLPEAAGIANGARIGGDGFGPSTLTEYNSWNNVVWRNDPDHVNLNVPGEEIIRPVVVSMAGAQLLLSDKAEFYESGGNLEGARRSSPVLFTYPGQLYDFYPVKTDNLLKGLRNANGGAEQGPLDADQWGINCPWWLLEIDRPFEHWMVLARLGWEPLPVATVRWKDLGLAEDREYVVYEFWSKDFLGIFCSGFDVPSQAAKDTRIYAIRAVQPNPQILSTSRHITQGGVDLTAARWTDTDNVMRGSSQVVRGDRYSITFRTPAGFQLIRATMDGSPAQIERSKDVATVSIVPIQTAEIAWEAQFIRARE